MSVPTQFASDAICSPIAIILDADGAQQSMGAQMPIAIVVDMDGRRARRPSTTWLSGLGDLISNLSAVRDWRQAHDRRAESSSTTSPA